jgi:DNA polymerase III epsilon subunit family exonuclease
MSKQPINWNKVPEEFVVFDLETTGLLPSKSTILEIGAIRFSKSDYLKTGQVDTFQVFVKQDEPIPAEIIKITSITDSMVANGDPLDVALKDFFKFVDGRNLIAYNAEFDEKFIRTCSRRAKVELPSWFRTECALELARKKLRGVQNYKLVTIAKAFGIDTDGAHRSLNDCLMTMHVYVNCLHIENTISHGQKYTKHKRSFDTDLEVVSNEFNYFYEFFHGLGEFIGSHKIVAVLLIATWVVFVVISNH